MRNKKGFKWLFPFIVPALLLAVLLIVMLVAYHKALGDEKSWTTEYFSMLADSCAHGTERLKLELTSESEYAGSLISNSGLQSEVMAGDFEAVFADSEAESGLVVT